MPPKPKVILKLVTLGDPGTGKTSLIQQFVNRAFKHSYSITIGLDVLSKSIKLQDREVELSINDIGGQQRFATMRQLFYTGSNLAMFVYDSTRPQTLANVESVWFRELSQFCPPRPNAPEVMKILIGNKVDLVDLRSVSDEEGAKVASRMGCDHILASAKENKNVDEAFTTLTKGYLDKFDK